MARYYLNVFNRTGSMADEEGQELPDLPAACGKAIDGIRSILSAEATEGMIDLCGRIEITDDAGDILSVLAFIDAFELYLPEAE